MKILKLRKMGWDIDKKEYKSDLINHRLRFENIELKKEYYKTLKYTAINSINGDILLGCNRVLGKMFFDTEYKTEDGMTWRPLELEKELNQDSDYNFNKYDFLKAINKISIKQYDNIEIIEMGY